MSKILFVINPVAGPHTHKKLVNQIKNKLNHHDDLYFQIWDRKEKFEDIKNDILTNRYEKIIAAGGDGTISLISELTKKINAVFGIIPTGSGNGYARHLKIPLTISNAIDVVLGDNILEVDTAEINGNYFINIAGLGFDALVSEKFGITKRRGILNYISLIIRHFKSYKPGNYTIEYNDTSWSGQAVVIDFALGSQYGNNAVISPLSDPSDGKIDVCILKPFSFLYSLVLLYHFYNKSIHKSNKYEHFKAKSVLIKNHDLRKAHYDGEPLLVPDEFTIEVSKSKLKVLVP